MDVAILWDEPDDENGNIQHISEHGLTAGEVESVLLSDEGEESVSRSSGLPMVFGTTNTGRYIAIVFEFLSGEDDFPIYIYVHTAYEVQRPKNRRRRRQ